MPTSILIGFIVLLLLLSAGIVTTVVFAVKLSNETSKIEGLELKKRELEKEKESLLTSIRDLESSCGTSSLVVSTASKNTNVVGWVFVCIFSVVGIFLVYSGVREKMETEESKKNADDD